MIRYNLILLFSFIFFASTEFCGISATITHVPGNIEIYQDTLLTNQTLYNGRLWRNIYYKIKEDQFLFSSNMQPGSVSISGQTYNDLLILYDIYNDEIIVTNTGGYKIQLNKEKIDSFSISFEDNTFHFINILTDTLKGFNGYLNLLVKGSTSLYVKYQKKIDPLAYERTFDMFSQFHHIYLVKDSIVQKVNSRRKLYNLLGANKSQVRNYVKKSRLYVSLKDPHSIIPVIKYSNSLSQ